MHYIINLNHILVRNDTVNKFYFDGNKWNIREIQFLSGTPCVWENRNQLYKSHVKGSNDFGKLYLSVSAECINYSLHNV